MVTLLQSLPGLILNPNMSLGRITGFGFGPALSAIRLLPAASCCGSALDVARYAFEPPRSNLLAGSRHLAKSSNDIFGLMQGTSRALYDRNKGSVTGASATFLSFLLT